MQPNFVAAVLGALAIAFVSTYPAFAGANDYVFEPVSLEVAKGHGSVMAVRLKHKATGKMVTDAVIIQTRLDMTPDGMPTYTSPVRPVPGVEPGVYAFNTDLSMAGRWLLSISAKVQGERETVIGKITFQAR